MTRDNIPSSLMLEDDRDIGLWDTSEEEDDLEELPYEQHPVTPPPVCVLYNEPTAVTCQKHGNLTIPNKHIPSDEWTNDGTNER